VRISVGWNTTHDDVDRFLERFPSVVQRVRDGLGREPAARARREGDGTV